MSVATKSLFGAGAIGALYAGLIHNPDAGCYVSAICRSNFDKVSKDGFIIDSVPLGKREFKPTKVFRTADDAAASGIEFDYVLVSTKVLPAIDNVAQLIAPLVVPGKTAIVLIQNGFDIEKPYVEKYPTNPIISAVTVAAAVQSEPGTIVHSRWHRISFGICPPGQFPAPKVVDEQHQPLVKKGTEMIQFLCDMLAKAGVNDAEVHDPFHLQLVRWHKAALNAAFNPSSVLSDGCSNRQMAENEFLLKHCSGVMQEYFDAGEKIFNVKFPPEGMASVEAVMKSTKKNVTNSKPSMWYDWVHARPMELDVILGNPIKYAARVGVTLPRAESMYGFLQMKEANRTEGHNVKI